MNSICSKLTACTWVVCSRYGFCNNHHPSHLTRARSLRLSRRVPRFFTARNTVPWAKSVRHTALNGIVSDSNFFSGVWCCEIWVVTYRYFREPAAFPIIIYCVKTFWERHSEPFFSHYPVKVFSFFFFTMAQEFLLGQGLLIVEDSRSHSDTSHTVGPLRMSDQPDAETTTWQHTTFTWDSYPWSRWDSNPQSQQASGRRPRCHWDRHPAKVSKVKWHLSGIKLMQNFMITSELWSLAAVYRFHFDSSVTMTITADSWQVDVWCCGPIRFEAKRHRKALTAMYFQKKQGTCKGM